MLEQKQPDIPYAIPLYPFTGYQFCSFVCLRKGGPIALLATSYRFCGAFLYNVWSNHIPFVEEETSLNGKRHAPRYIQCVSFDSPCFDLICPEIQKQFFIAKSVFLTFTSGYVCNETG